MWKVGHYVATIEVFFYSPGNGEPLKVEQGSEMIKAHIQKRKKERQTTKWTAKERAVRLKL